MTKIPLYFIILFLILGYVNAATIHGTIYDENLDVLKEAIVKVNSVPEQKMVAKDGSYSFNLVNGNYIISASYADYSIEENLSIKTEGDYILDLIIFPALEEAKEPPEIKEEAKTNYSYLLILVIFVIIAIVLVFYLKKRQKKSIEKLENIELADDLQQLLKFIKDNSGRTTQKEIRKFLNLSEAKVSLMVTELEHKDLVKRIKKGRGNIIILNR